MIIADENLEQYWIDLFRADNYELFSIRENSPGISDHEVAELVKTKRGWLITEDKDFGELVFSYGLKNISIILLRYDQPFYSQIESVLLKFVSEHKEPSINLFVTITPGRIRIRSI